MIEYLIHMQYLGFRFHGWQRQPDVKTVEGMLVKTLEEILGDTRVKILGSSRTDAMVSANHAAFALFVDRDVDTAALLHDLNLNLPSDIRILSVETPEKGFNIIKSPRSKTYRYYFCHGTKIHPFCAPFLASFPDGLDVDLMKQGACLFEGRHNFRRYCSRPGKDTQFVREVLYSRIGENRDLTASFFPEQTWVYTVRAKGFMRNQVRLMMGQLLRLGRGEIGLAGIEESLSNPPEMFLRNIAPASGLVLHQIEFDDKKDGI